MDAVGNRTRLWQLARARAPPSLVRRRHRPLVES
jgi:hypothetical protein